MSLNSSGNQRGVTPLAQEQLANAREKRRSATYQKSGKKPAPPNIPRAFSFTKMLKGSPSALHERIRKYVELAELEPGALTATVIGTLMAELDQANGTLKKMWKWLDTFLDAGGEASNENAIKLMGELRKWTETMQGAALKVAEIQAKGMSQREGDPLDKYCVDSEEIAEEAECEVSAPSVTIDTPAPASTEVTDEHQPQDEAATQ